MSTLQTIGVLLVEDETPTRNHFSSAVDTHPKLNLIAATGSCTDAIAALHKHKPNILVADLGLPDGCGVQIINKAKALYPDIEILVVTMFDDEENVIAALEAGASGYLLKKQAFVGLADAILSIMRGEAAISPEVARFLLKRFNTPSVKSKSAHDNPLTERENEVLNWISKGYSYNEIAGILDVSANTIRTRIRNIYKKLAVKSRSEAVFEASNMGILELNNS